MLSYEEKRAELDRLLADNHRQREAIDAEWLVLRRQDAALTDRRLVELTDEQILTDVEILRWLCKAAEMHTGASRRLHVLSDVWAHLRIDRIDSCNNYYGFPMPTVIVEHNTNAAEVVAELRSWFRIWNLGRHDVLVDVQQSKLKHEKITYNIHYRPDNVAEATLIRLCYSDRDEVMHGSLMDVLAYVAEYHPYNKGLGRPGMDF